MSGVLALLRFGNRRVRQRLQFHDGGGSVDTPEVDNVAASGNAAWQGKYLCLGGGPVFGELDL